MKVLIATLILVTNAFAQDLMYPELNVVPRASKRVYLEAKDEAGSAWTYHLPVQLASLTTLTAALMSDKDSIDLTKDEDQLSPKVAMLVSGVWLGLTSYAALAYRPYRETYGKLKGLSGKSKRDQLLKERMAEEEINSLRRLGKRIRWASAISNMVVASNLESNLKDDTDAKVVAGLAQVVSLTSLFFTYRWEDVADEQEAYKKKIFGPVAMAPIMQNGFDNSATTGVSLLWRF